MFEVRPYNTVIQYFLKLKQKGPLQSSYLLVGSSAESNFLVAREIAKLKYCLAPSYPCAGCEPCSAFERRAQYDVWTVEEEMIKREQVKGVQDFLRLRSAGGAGRTVLIKNIETITEEAANAFLKILEEPPPLSCILATTTRKDVVIPTIQSRFRKIYLPAAEVIPGKYEAVNEEAARRILSEGFTAVKEKDRKTVETYLSWLILFLRDALAWRLTGSKECLMEARNYEIILVYAASWDPVQIVSIMEKCIVLHGDIENMNINLAKNIVDTLIRLRQTPRVCP